MPWRLAAIVLLAACGSRDPDPVRIGLVVSEEAIPGAEIAVEEINGTGGIDGRPLALKTTQATGTTRAELAIAQAESLSADPTVIGVVGHSSSGTSLTAAQIYNARGVVQIAPTSSSPLLSQAGSFTFRLVPSDVHQARFLAALVLAERSRPRVAIVFVNDDYGRALYGELTTLLQDSARIVHDSPYLEGDSLQDVQGVARDIASRRPDVLVWLGRAPQLGQLLPALRREIPGLRVLASDGVDNATTDRNAGGVLTGLRFACFVDPMASRPRLSAVRARYLRRRGAPITAEAILVYDAVMLLAHAARADGPRRAAVRDHLASIGTTRPPFAGASGGISFDDQGDPRPAYCLAEIAATGRRTLRSRPE